MESIEFSFRGSKGFNLTHMQAAVFINIVKQLKKCVQNVGIKVSGMPLTKALSYFIISTVVSRKTDAFVNSNK